MLFRPTYIYILYIYTVYCVYKVYRGLLCIATSDEAIEMVVIIIIRQSTSHLKRLIDSECCCTLLSNIWKFDLVTRTSCNDPY